MKRLSREDWEEIEDTFITSKKNYDELADEILLDTEDYDKAQKLIKQIRICENWCCETAFLPNSNRQRYCSEKCKHNQKSATDRLMKYGTYLTQWDIQRFKQLYRIRTENALELEQKRHWVSWESLFTNDEGEFEEGELPREPLRYDRVTAEVKKYQKLNKKQPVTIYYLTQDELNSLLGNTDQSIREYAKAVP